MPTYARYVLSLSLLTAAALPASAHPAGACALAPTDRCERWSATYDAPAQAGTRSDQFAQQVLLGTDAVYVVLKDVAFRPSDPYAATARGVVAAYDRLTGALRWSAARSDRAYFSPHQAVLSADGRRLYVSGAAYDGFPVGAKDSTLTTTAYDTATGAVAWSVSWDGRPDGTDSSKGIVLAPGGDEVYVTGVTTAAGGDLDYVTLAYRASDGRALWQQTYAGPRPQGQDAPFGIAVTPDGDTLVVTGWSDGVVDYDADYLTVAYDLRHGHKARLLWTARYDGIGAHKSDRAMAVSADATRVYVTGDSYAGTTGSGYDYATVAYDARRGTRVWDARWSGGRGGFNSPDQVAVAGSRVVVTGQASAVSKDDGNDAGTVAFDATTGRRLWQATFGAARHDDYARGLALSPDGGTAYVVTSDIPIVPYTALTRLSVVAYDTGTGAVRWQSTLDPSPGDALSGAGVAADAGTVAVAGDVTRSANPLGDETQNVYDVLVAAFPA
jgi:WD40 repeat protein